MTLLRLRVMLRLRIALRSRMATSATGGSYLHLHHRVQTIRASGSVHHSASDLKTCCWRPRNKQSHTSSSMAVRIAKP